MSPKTKKNKWTLKLPWKYHVSKKTQVVIQQKMKQAMMALQKMAVLNGFYVIYGFVKFILLSYWYFFVPYLDCHCTGSKSLTI